MIMKGLKKIMSFVLVGALFAACSKDIETVEPSAPSTGGELVPTTLSISVPSMNSPVVSLVPRTESVRMRGEEAVSLSSGDDSITRAGDTSATDAEKAVKNLWILQFDNSNGKLMFKEVVENVTLTDSKASLAVALEASDNCTVYAIANVGKNKFDSAEKDKYLLSALEADGFGVGTSFDIKNGLPMSAKWTGQTKDPSAYDEQHPAPTFKMERMVAKVTFTCKFAPEISTHKFTLESIQLCSVPESAAYKAPKDDATGIPDATKAKFIDYTIENPASLDNAYTWYMPENLRGKGLNSSSGATAAGKGEDKAPAHSTYVEVKGKYNNGSETSDITFRIFPGADDKNDFNIARNCKYTMTATIVGNSENDSRVVIAVDLSRNPFDQSEETANSYMVSKAGCTYKFKATVMGNGATTPASSISGQNAPAITPSALNPQSVKVLWETNGEGKIIKDVQLKNGWVYFTTAGEKSGSITEGNAVIAVYSSATAGDHMNVLWSWHIWSTAYDPMAVGGTHTHKTRAISSNSSYNNVPQRSVAVMTRNLGAANNTQGNVGSFGLLYQWGRKDPFVGSDKTTANNTTFVTTYPNSWPIVASSATTSGTGATPQDKSIDYAVKHPTTFITQINTTTYDWLNAPAITNQRDNLWGNPNKTAKTPNPEQGAKSIYDPCPVGWRVAPQDTWTMFSKTGINTSTSGEFNVSGGFNIGWNFYYEGTATGSTVYYPAAGYRTGSTGALTGVGTHGYVYSSSSYAAGDRHAGYLYFLSGYVRPLSGASRAAALSVRCVQN